MRVHMLGNVKLVLRLRIVGILDSCLNFLLKHRMFRISQIEHLLREPQTGTTLSSLKNPIIKPTQTKESNLNSKDKEY